MEIVISVLVGALALLFIPWRHSRHANQQGTTDIQNDQGGARVVAASLIGAAVAVWVLVRALL